jgi:uncharacterized protein (TIGR02996 family)
MPVHFVYRCHYGAPSEKHVRRFEYDTVLDWAKAVYRQLPEDEASEYAEQLLGGLHVYSFDSLFMLHKDEAPSKCPQTMEDVGGWFTRMYDQGLANGPHHIQLLTDDDEIEMAVYVFDDHYRKANPGKADFLLLDGWELPAGESGAEPPQLPKTQPVEPAGEGEGRLYVMSLYATDSSNLSDLSSAGHIDGVRVSDFARHLMLHPDEDGLGLGLMEASEAIRAVLKNPVGEDAGFLVAIRDQPDELTHWGAYSDWLQERDLPPAGLHLLERALRGEGYGYTRDSRTPSLDRVKVTPHVAQACKNEGRYPNEPSEELTPRDTFAQFIFFDDRWATAHPTLAAGILTFASRWDVLS